MSFFIILVIIKPLPPCRVPAQCLESREYQEYRDTVMTPLVTKHEAIGERQVLLTSRTSILEDVLGKVQEEGRRTRENTIATATALADELGAVNREVDSLAREL